ncbi:MAG: CD225/dispanin family protein [Rhodococcus sp. (in: high G+C Gram-positive bacteria)]|uniref:CD225/dispanin family protein n=1 Tax=Rhodococcus sp. TaxID=1831 RepID=UPI003BB0AA24
MTQPHTTDHQDTSADYRGPLAPPPARHLPLAILATITFVPFGVLALLRARTVNRLWEQSEYDASVRAAADVRQWSVRSFAVAVAIIVVTGTVLLVTRA